MFSSSTMAQSPATTTNYSIENPKELDELLKKQELEFGFNMFDVLTGEDDVIVDEYVMRGYPVNEAILIVFEKKMAQVRSDKQRLHRQTSQQQSMRPQRQETIRNDNPNDILPSVKDESEIEKLVARGMTITEAMDHLRSTQQLKNTDVRSQQALPNYPKFDRPNNSQNNTQNPGDVQQRLGNTVGQHSNTAMNLNGITYNKQGNYVYPNPQISPMSGNRLNSPPVTARERNDEPSHIPPYGQPEYPLYNNITISPSSGNRNNGPTTNPTKQFFRNDKYEGELESKSSNPELQLLVARGYSVEKALEIIRSTNAMQNQHLSSELQPSVPKVGVRTNQEFHTSGIKNSNSNDSSSTTNDLSANSGNKSTYPYPSNVSIQSGRQLGNIPQPNPKYVPFNRISSVQAIPSQSYQPVPYPNSMVSNGYVRNAAATSFYSTHSGGVQPGLHNHPYGNNINIQRNTSFHSNPSGSVQPVRDRSMSISSYQNIPQVYVPPTTATDDEALETALILSQQESEFGINMIDSLCPEDDLEIEYLLKLGYKRREVFQIIFDRKFRGSSTIKSAAGKDHGAGVNTESMFPLPNGLQNTRKHYNNAEPNSLPRNVSGASLTAQYSAQINSHYNQKPYNQQMDHLQPPRPPPITNNLVGRQIQNNNNLYPNATPVLPTYSQYPQQAGHQPNPVVNVPDGRNAQKHPINSLMPNPLSGNTLFSYPSDYAPSRTSGTGGKPEDISNNTSQNDFTAVSDAAIAIDNNFPNATASKYFRSGSILSHNSHTRPDNETNVSSGASKGSIHDSNKMAQVNPVGSDNQLNLKQPHHARPQSLLVTALTPNASSTQTQNNQLFYSQHNPPSRESGSTVPFSQLQQQPQYERQPVNSFTSKDSKNRINLNSNLDSPGVSHQNSRSRPESISRHSVTNQPNLVAVDKYHLMERKENDQIQLPDKEQGMDESNNDHYQVQMARNSAKQTNEDFIPKNIENMNEDDLLAAAREYMNYKKTLAKQTNGEEGGEDGGEELEGDDDAGEAGDQFDSFLLDINVQDFENASVVSDITMSTMGTHRLSLRGSRKSSVPYGGGVQPSRSNSGKINYRNGSTLQLPVEPIQECEDYPEPLMPSLYYNPSQDVEASEFYQYSNQDPVHNGYGMEAHPSNGVNYPPNEVFESYNMGNENRSQTASKSSPIKPSVAPFMMSDKRIEHTTTTTDSINNNSVSRSVNASGYDKSGHDKAIETLKATDKTTPNSSNTLSTKEKETAAVKKRPSLLSFTTSLFTSKSSNKQQSIASETKVNEVESLPSTFDHDMTTLIHMGYTKERAKEALQTHNYDLAKTITDLMRKR